jgi:hypothetical protein
MSCEQLKVVTVSAGTYSISPDGVYPCRYTVRWRPDAGQEVTLIAGARQQRALRAVREHRVLGDTIQNLMSLNYGFGAAAG